jgi:hypothetical protein
VTFSGQDDVVKEFEDGKDTYASLASEIFGFPVNKKDHPTERFVGKQGRLGLGYQLGAPKFKNRLKADSKNQTGNMICLTDEEAYNVVKTFRRLNYKVEQSWGLLNAEVSCVSGKLEFVATGRLTKRRWNLFGTSHKQNARSVLSGLHNSCVNVEAYLVGAQGLEPWTR